MKKLFKILSITALSILTFGVASVSASVDYNIVESEEIYNTISDQFADDEYGGFYINDSSNLVIKILESNDVRAENESIDKIQRIIDEYGLDGHVEIEYTKYDVDTLKEQVEIIKEYMQLRTEEYRNISLIGYTESEGVIVGMTDTNDEELKNNILSIPGIIAELIEFNEFIVDWETVLEPFMGDEIENYEHEEENIASRRVYQMGDIISLSSAGYGTKGLPYYQSGESFLTFNHGMVSVGQTISSSGSTIGRVDRTYFGGSRDASRVDMSSYGHTVSTTVPDSGLRLFNIAGNAPAAGTSVKAYTGYSGIVNGSIYGSSMEVKNPDGVVFTDMIHNSMKH